MLVAISLASLAPRVSVTLGITKLSSGSVETPPSPATAIALSQVVQGPPGPPGPTGPPGPVGDITADPLAYYILSKS